MVSLPASGRPSNRVRRGRHFRGAGRVRRRRVLVVDDDADTRAVLVEALNDEPDLAAESVESGEAALRRLEVDGDVDLVLSDLVMPGLNGFDLIDRLEARPAGARVPVVVMTALDEASVEADERAARFAALVAKPFDLTELTEVLRAVLASALAPGRCRSA